MKHVNRTSIANAPSQDNSERLCSYVRPGYLPIGEAARWAGVSTTTIKRWLGKGLPRYQAGLREKVLIKPDDIDAWLTKKTVPSVDVAALVQQSIAAVTKKHTSAV